MKPQSRQDMVEAWNRLKHLDPSLASQMDPFIREFGCEELIVVSYQKPLPRPHGFSPHHAVLEQQVTAFPEVARAILSSLDAMSPMNEEGKVWWD